MYIYGNGVHRWSRAVLNSFHSSQKSILDSTRFLLFFFSLLSLSLFFYLSICCACYITSCCVPNFFAAERPQALSALLSLSLLLFSLLQLSIFNVHRLCPRRFCSILIVPRILLLLLESIHLAGLLPVSILVDSGPLHLVSPVSPPASINRRFLQPDIRLMTIVASPFCPRTLASRLLLASCSFPRPACTAL